MILDKKSMKRIQKLLDVCGVILILLAVHFVVGAFSGKWPWSINYYNSYTLQAVAWLEGHLDLGGNVEWLELAIYQGKYFVSFPPFPSYVMLPFAMFYGTDTPDGWIALFVMIIGALYALHIAWEYLGFGNKAVFWTAFLYVGTNVLYITIDGGVWFIAQSMAFTLSLMAIYYAMKGKGGLSLFLWGCSVGCRPLQVVYFPLLLYVLYTYLKKKNPNRTLRSMIKEKFYWAIPVCLIALSYMLLNYARFGNPLEFGHNYLPEFTESEHGQFHGSYILNNLKTLFRMPEKGEKDVLVFSKFNGNCIFLVTPIFVSYILYYIRKFVRKQKIDKAFMILLPLLIIIHIVGLCAHLTMGGWHFGHRYINDVLPYLYWGLLIFAGTSCGEKINVDPQPDVAVKNNEHVEDENEENIDAINADVTNKNAVSDMKMKKEEITQLNETEDYTYTLHYALCFLGVTLNVVGAIVVNMGWI